MKKINGRPLLLILMSFVIPCVVIAIALAGLGVTPFGDKTLVISDGDGLYINFLAYVGRAVKGQEGFLYSFEKSLGGNMMGSWGWFLLNPFFALFALFDITNYPLAFTLVSTMNLSLCGLTMYLLLADVYGHRLSHLIFSTAYALIGFNVANVFQMNFFTGVSALPIMALGLRRLLKGRNPAIYILALAYSLLTSFYFGFMLCAASLLLFLAYLITNWGELRDRRVVVARYGLSSLLAGRCPASCGFPRCSRCGAGGWTRACCTR